MIHYELLARINANLCGLNGCDGEHYKKDNLNGEWFALRAVVELHKPFHPEFGGGIDYCFADDFAYPCPTIQAIEKYLL